MRDGISILFGSRRLGLIVLRSVASTIVFMRWVVCDTIKSPPNVLDKSSCALPPYR